MAAYTVQITKNVEKVLDRLPDRIVYPILERIADLANNPRPKGCKKLRGRNGYRFRQGNYRIIYEIFDSELVVVIIAVGHRKDICL